MTSVPSSVTRLFTLVVIFFQFGTKVFQGLPKLFLPFSIIDKHMIKILLLKFVFHVVDLVPFLSEVISIFMDLVLFACF